MVQVAYSFGNVEPHRVVLPVFGANDSGAPMEFLGTGFVATSRRLFVTTHHVIKDWQGPVVALLTAQNEPIPLDLVARDEDADLVIYDLGVYSPHDWFRLADDDEIRENRFVVCPEYGSTRRLGDEIQISIATRVGNITRRFVAHDQFGKAGEGALELSFPALLGSSGAPILSSEDMKVWGVLAANVAYHLIPAQIERVLGEDGEVLTETQFMLPQAIGINVSHLRELMPR